MAIRYEIDPARRLIHTRCLGDVNFAEVLAHFRALQTDPGVPAEPDVLLDFSELTAFPDSGQVRSISSVVRSLEPTLAWRHCAIVAPADLGFAIGRMFGMLSEPAFRAMMVFRRFAEAEQWLAARCGPAGAG